MFAGFRSRFVFTALFFAACGVTPEAASQADISELALASQGGLSRNQLERLARRHLIEHMGDAARMAGDRAPNATVVWNGTPLNAAQVLAQDGMFYNAFPDIHADNEELLAIDEAQRTVTFVASYVGTWTGPFYLPDGTELQPATPARFVSSPSTVTVTFKPNGKVIRSTMNFDTVPLLRALGLVP